MGRKGGGMRKKQTQPNRNKKRPASKQALEDAKRGLQKASRRIDALGRQRAAPFASTPHPAPGSSATGGRGDAGVRACRSVEDPLLTITEVAEILTVSTQRAYELARKGLLPVVRLGRQVRVAPAQLADWIVRGGQT